MKLDAKSFALAAGIIWGLGLALLTVISLTTGYLGDMLTSLGSTYVGYTISVTGIFVGLVYGFLDAFIGCYIFAWLYNKLVKK